MDLVLFQGVIADSVKFCELHKEQLEFKHGNGKHGVRLIKLPMSMNNNGIVTPKIKPCIDEIISSFGDEEEAAHDIVDTLLEYMINNHKRIFEDKLQEKQLTPKIMNEFDVTALLQVSGITIWQ